MTSLTAPLLRVIPAVLLCLTLTGVADAGASSGPVVGWGSGVDHRPPATDIAAGGGHSCAIQAGTGDVVCWGSNTYDQATPPDAVNGISGTATDIAAGDFHSCAIQAGTGNVVCWGWDYSGQATPPDAVNGVLGTATNIAAGGYHTLAIVAAPEPSALTALESGIAMLALLYRRRRRSAKS